MREHASTDATGRNDGHAWTLELRSTGPTIAQERERDVVRALLTLARRVARSDSVTPGEIARALLEVGPSHEATVVGRALRSLSRRAGLDREADRRRVFHAIRALAAVETFGVIDQRERRT